MYTVLPLSLSLNPCLYSSFFPLSVLPPRGVAPVYSPVIKKLAGPGRVYPLSYEKKKEMTPAEVGTKDNIDSFRRDNVLLEVEIKKNMFW